MTAREIGSEFWDVPISDSKNSVLNNNRIVWYLSGRSALSAIIRDISSSRKVSRVLMPSWCCESMIAPFIEVCAEVEFYSVLIADGKIVIDYPQHFDADVVVVMDYFGYSFDNQIPNVDFVVIRDVTHSVFSRQYFDADYYFGSLRKWAGFYTGGFAIKQSGQIAQPCLNNAKYVLLRKHAMAMKKTYIDGKRADKEYLKVFSEAEQILDSDSEIYCADDTDITRARYLDVEFIKRKRRENAAVLLSRLDKLALFSPKANDCPLFVPIAVANRDELNATLVSESVYCPCHWNISELHRLSADEKLIYDCELSVVCDQRYNADDMNRICDIIERTAKAC